MDVVPVVVSEVEEVSLVGTSACTPWVYSYAIWSRMGLSVPEVAPEGGKWADGVLGRRCGLPRLDVG